MTRAILSAIIVAIFLHASLISAKRPDFIDDDMMEMIKDDKQECMKEHGTTQELIDKASEGSFANDRSITCYMACLLTRLGMMDENGDLDKDMMLGVVPDNLQATAQKVMDMCGSSAGADGCEKIFNAAQCVISNCPDMWFMV